MRTAARSTLLAGLSLPTLGANEGWPIKTIDPSNGGANCDTETEQYLQVEAYDFHDHPKLTMRWRQTTGACGASVDESELLSWEASYDGSTDDAEDDPPNEQGRVQLNLFVCCPFGEYEIDLDIQSFSDDGSTLEQRTAWEIENGPDEYHIWDTVNTDLANVEEYSPTETGVYTWPLEGETGYYSTLYAGPLPPLECASTVPSGTQLLGCYADSSSNRLFGSDELVLNEMGPDGMTGEICSDFCSEYDFFGLEYGSECFCGTAEEFNSAVSSEQCGMTYKSLCTGDATTACGGVNSISVFERIDSGAPTPTSTQYSLVGCFPDSRSSRIMGNKMVKDEMSAKVCFGLCNDGTNTHFGTQFADECWCAVDADLAKNGEMLATTECDMLCSGTDSGEFCGGRDKITAYEIGADEYIGCYGDTSVRAMNAEGKYTNGNMTNEACISFCGGKGHAYAGTQYSSECWCGDSFDLYGSTSEELCSYTCEGDVDQICGGYFALSVYSTA